VHPEVFLDFSMWLHEKEEKGYKIVLLESAIIFSAPAFIEKIDAVLVVDAPEQVRIERVMKRDGISEIQVRERMRRQMSPGEMIKRADFIIYTDGRRAVLPQVINVIKEINKRLTK
jgi:dephospho-CoA kinase